MGSKISFVQMPYLENPKGAREIGERIGRIAQSFEIRELVIAPYVHVNADELLEFLKSVRRGKESRLKIPEKELCKRYKGNRTLPFTTFSRPSETREEKRAFLSPQIQQGGRTGPPKGILRLSDFVIDLTPYIMFSTEIAVPASLIALLDVYEEMVQGR